MRSLSISRERLPHLMLWLLVIGLVAGVNVVAIPIFFDSAVELRDFTGHERDDIRRALDALNLTSTHLAWYWVAAGALTSLAYLAIGWLLVRRGQPAVLSVHCRCDNRPDRRVVSSRYRRSLS
jgi:hypothetical protein